MKKLLLSASVLLIAQAQLFAQTTLTLNGTSYSQDFNAIGTSIPTGWNVYTNATSSSLGDLKTFSGAKRTWHDTYGNFKNYASANGQNAATDSITQTNATDRALGVRQVSATNTNFPNSDPGAAFVLKIANTQNLTAFALDFKLQSLVDTTPRTTTWTIDYATGATPTTFTAVPAGQITGTLTTGGSTFSNNAVHVDFQSLLDNQAGPVWIRIAAVAGSTGAGTRASSAIDDVNLTWTGQANGIYDVTRNNLPVQILGDASAGKIVVSYTAGETANYTVSIYDMNGRAVYTTSTRAVKGSNQQVLTGMNLAAGMYLLQVKGATEQGSAKVMVK